MALPNAPKALTSYGAPSGDERDRRVDEWARGTQALLVALRKDNEDLRARLATAGGGGGASIGTTTTDLVYGGAAVPGTSSDASAADHIHGLEEWELADLDAAVVGAEYQTRYTFNSKPVWRCRFAGTTPGNGFNGAISATGFAYDLLRIDGYVIYDSGGGRISIWYGHSMLGGAAERTWTWIETNGALQMYTTGTFFAGRPYNIVVYYTKP